MATNGGNSGSGSTTTVTYSTATPVMTLANVRDGLAETTFLASRIKVADIVISSSAFTTAHLTLSGKDALAFQIDGSQLFLRGGRGFDFETLQQLEVSVVLDNPAIGSGPEETAVVCFPILDVNEAPSFSLSTSSLTLAENFDTTTRIKVTDLIVVDDALGTENFALSGSGASLFELDGLSLYIRAGAQLDFETLSMPQVTVTMDDPTLGTGPEGAKTFSLTLTDVNDPPRVQLQNVTVSIDENTNLASRLRVADIVVTDDAFGSGILSLSGPQAGLFEIVGSSLFLKAGTPLDHEGLAQFQVNVDVDDPTLGSGPDNTAALTFFVNDINEAPSVSLANVVSTLPENTSTATRLKVADIVVADDALGQNALTLGGADASFFQIDGQTLYIRAGTSLNFESKSAYALTVSIDDPTVGLSPDATVAYALSLTDVNEPPAIALTQLVTTLAENASTATRTKVADFTVTNDALGTANTALAGADASLFEFDSNALFLKAGALLDFETNPRLDVTVTVTDPTLTGAPQGSAPISITINNVNEAPQVSLINTLTSLSERTSTVVRIKVADIVVTDDALGTETLGLAGPNAASFEISGNALFLKAGVVLDFETAPQLDVSVTIDDPTIGSGVDNSAAFVLPIIDSNEPPLVSLINHIGAIAENADTRTRTKIADIVVTDDALGNNRLGLGGSDAGLFEIIGTTLYLKAGVALNFETKSVFSARVTVNDTTLPPDPNADVSVGLTVLDVNETPSLAVTNVQTTLTESIDTTNPFKVADITVTDDALGTNNLSLAGTNASLFSIIGNGLFLNAGTQLDFGATPTLQVLVRLDDPELGTTFESSATLNFTVQDTVRTGTEADDIVVGTAFSDRLFGLAGNDTLIGGALNDVLDGGAGTDVAVLFAQQKNYTLTLSVDGTTVSDRRVDGTGTDTLIDIEQLRFSSNPTGNPNSGPLFDLAIFDGVLDATLEQLETLTLLYMALYDRAPDALGLYYWATHYADGLDIDIITQAFIDSPEAIQIYGAAPTPAEIVSKAYENVLQRIPDAAGAQFWTSLIEQQIITPAEYFALFAEGVQNNPSAGDDRQTLADQTDIGLYFSAILGLSNANDATTALAAYDASDRANSLANVKGLIDGYHADALSTGPSGEFLVPLLGIVENPFDMG